MQLVLAAARNRRWESARNSRGASRVEPRSWIEMADLPARQLLPSVPSNGRPSTSSRPGRPFPHRLVTRDQAWQRRCARRRHANDGPAIVQVNPAFEWMTGYGAAEAIGKNVRYLQGADRQQPEIAEMRAALAEGRDCAVTLRNYRRDGTMFRNALRLTPLRDDAGRVTHFVGVMRDVTHSAGTDRLTGLTDRYGLLDRLAAIEGPPPTALLVVKLDIVRFHDVNHGFGYEMGDKLLCLVAARLATLPAEAVSRVGSNSFALAFRLADRGCAATTVETVLSVLKPHFVLPVASLAVQFATGYTVGSFSGHPLHLIRQAGTALHRSKATCPHAANAFAVADEVDACNRIQLASELQTAVADQELLFHYQPQVDLESGDLVGAEALLRWEHKSLGLQPPGQFIGIAEETGALLEIGAWGLHTLAGYAAGLNRARSTPIRFALNVSMLEFMQSDMVGAVRRVLDETGCLAEWLTLELTENLMAPEPESIRRTFERLRRLGVNISIDDFGTGYSNLRYLERFPMTEIKVDRSFVHGAAHSKAKRVIVESIVRLGATLDVRVVAEGVETEAECGLMRALGCSVGQGYFFARPLAEPRFRESARARAVPIVRMAERREASSVRSTPLAVQ